MLRSKEEIRKNREIFLPKFECRKELGMLLDYIDKQRYSDHIDYSYFYQMLRLVSLKNCDRFIPFSL